MKLRHFLITASLLTGLSAIAQTTTSTDTANPSRSAQPTGPMQKMHDAMVRRHEKHWEELKASLKLKPEQESQWTAFTNSMKPHSLEHHAMTMADMDKLSTPERIDKMAGLKAQHDAEIQKRGDATKAFYATLSEEQKKTFDQQTAKFMHRMAERHHGGPRQMMHTF